MRDLPGLNKFSKVLFSIKMWIKKRFHRGLFIFRPLRGSGKLLIDKIFTKWYSLRYTFLLICEMLNIYIGGTATDDQRPCIWSSSMKFISHSKSRFVRKVDVQKDIIIRNAIIYCFALKVLETEFKVQFISRFLYHSPYPMLLSTCITFQSFLQRIFTLSVNLPVINYK